MARDRELKTCAIFNSEPLTDSWQFIIQSHLRLLAKHQYQIVVNDENIRISENLKNNVTLTMPTKKKTTLLSKLFKPLIGKSDDTITLSGPAFSISYGLDKHFNWSDHHILFLEDLNFTTEDVHEHFNKLQKIIVNSQYLKKTLIEKHKIAAPKIDVLYPFYARELYSNKDKVHLRNFARQKLNFGSKDFVIGYTDAPPEFISSLSQTLSTLATAKPTGGGEIKLVGYQKDLSTHAMFYQSLDIFIMPVSDYKFGIQGLEAMACGIPLLTSPIAGVSDLVLSKQFVKELQLESWATYLAELSHQRDWLVSVGRQNGERAILFEENQHLKRLIQIFASENIFRLD